MDSDISLRLPDGSERSVPAGTTGLDVARSIGSRLARAAVAVTLDGDVLDLERPLPRGGDFSVLTVESEGGRTVLRHSTAHVLAQAVLALYPGATFAIGPPIENGFYYDFELSERISDEDLDRIEDKMREIVAADQAFVRAEVSKPEGMEIFAGHPYKQEIIETAESAEGAAPDAVSLYRNDGFVDLCRGPHVPSTGRLGHFKLQRVAGAYWRGDVTRPQLQRIYGTAWESKAALEAHLHQLEEAKRRDHRRLGVDLDLFSFPDEVGQGLVVWHPKGGMVRKIMEDYSRAEHEREGYSFVMTPNIGRSRLWEISGHLQWYADGMYPPMTLDEDEQYYLKPMSCPFHILVYRSRPRSYRELPVRLYELANVYRYELSGAIHGLTRPRGFTQDDSHIFCTEEQLLDELNRVIAFAVRVLKDFGLADFEAEFQTRPEKFVGDIADWDRAEAAILKAIDASGLPYVVGEGEGTFYAPKVSIYVRDAIGRRWQLSTLQVDFQFPQRFDLWYTGADNQQHRPFMLHRALYGSVERFFSILTEHYAGAFPLWLAPLQVAVLPVAERHDPYAADVAARLREAGFRVEVRPPDETLGNRIRHATEEKVPYMAIVGDDDVAASTVGLRTRSGDDRRGVALDEFEASLREEVTTRRS
jgi:threonyl-tRNA synthetase